MAAPVRNPRVTCPFRYKSKRKPSPWAAGYHPGVDFAANVGTAVYAPLKSKIIFAGRGGWGSAYGIHVIGECEIKGVKHRWITAHLSKETVSVGQIVNAGQRLGSSGATGNTFGPHVHFEVRQYNPNKRDGVWGYWDHVNPAAVIGAKAVEVPKGCTDWKPECFYLGAKGSHVTKLGERLVAHGFGHYYKSGPGPTFTETDQKAVAAFQRQQGYSGLGADGFPGTKSLARLLEDPKPVAPPKPVVQGTFDNRVLGINVGADWVGGFPGRVDELESVRDAARASLVLACESGPYSDGELLNKEYGWGGHRYGEKGITKQEASFVLHSGNDVRISTAQHWNTDDYDLLDEAWEHTLKSSTHDGITWSLLQHRDSKTIFIAGTIHCVPWPIGPNDEKKWNDQRYKETALALDRLNAVIEKCKKDRGLAVLPGLLGEDFNGTRTDSKYPGGDGPGRAAKAKGWVDAYEIAKKRNSTKAIIDRIMVTQSGVIVREHNLLQTKGGTDHPYGVGLALTLSNVA